MWAGSWCCEHECAVVSEVSPWIAPSHMEEGMLMVRVSEISPAKERGKFVTMNHVGFITGLATGLWYASTVFAVSSWSLSSNYVLQGRLWHDILDEPQ